MKLRIKFKKRGALRFIGHLDVMRFFQKCIRRAGIDVAYTGGFSPHQIMSFAAPLAIGLESNGEYMDIEVHSFSSCEDVKRRLNAASVEEIEIVSVKILPEEAKNAMASVAAASYTVRFRKEIEPNLNFPEAIEEFLSRDQLLITKTTKKGSREIDLKAGIYEMKWIDNAFYLVLDASSAGNIKPSQVIGSLLSANKKALPENALLVTREDTFTDLGTNGTRTLVPLDAVGYDQMQEKEGA